jgi:hypothetical protein
MGTPFLGVKTWKELKTPVFSIKVMLIIILGYINYQVGLMINKPKQLSVKWLPKVALFSSDASLFVNFVADGWKKRFTHTRETFYVLLLLILSIYR